MNTEKKTEMRQKALSNGDLDDFLSACSPSFV